MSRATLERAGWRKRGDAIVRRQAGKVESAYSGSSIWGEWHDFRPTSASSSMTATRSTSAPAWGLTTRDEFARVLRQSPRLPEEREVPELRPNARSKLTFTLGTLASDTIRDEIRRSADLMTDHEYETGGYLFATRTSGFTCWQLHATGMGASGKRGVRKVQLDYDEAILAARSARASGLHDFQLAGSWHCHPWSDPSPSGPDRTGALWTMEWADLNTTTFAVDLIFTPGRDRGWRDPQPHAWVTRRDDRGRAVTEPTTIKGA